MVGVVALTYRVHGGAYYDPSLILLGIYHCRFSDAVLGNMYVLVMKIKMEVNTTSRHAKIVNGKIFIYIYIYIICSIINHDDLRMKVV